MDTECTRRMAAALLRDGEAGVSAAVDAVVLAWTPIDRELTPLSRSVGSQIRTPRPPLCPVAAVAEPGPHRVTTLMRLKARQGGPRREVRSAGFGQGSEFLVRLPRLPGDAPPAEAPC
jgi:hypothetical protein